MNRACMTFMAFTAFSASLCAQQSVPWRASVTTSLNASASYVVTVQQNGANVQNLQTATISCVASGGTSNTFTVAQSQNGTAAANTAVAQTTTGTLATSANGLIVLSPWPLNTTLNLKLFAASDVGTGVATSGPIAYSSTAVIGLAGRVLASTATNQNYTFTVTNTGSGACTLIVEVLGSQVQ